MLRETTRKSSASRKPDRQDARVEAALLFARLTPRCRKNSFIRVHPGEAGWSNRQGRRYGLAKMVC